MNKPNQENIEYTLSKDSIRSLQIGNFFAGWQKKPSDESLIKSIEGADYVVLAVDKTQNLLIGYITAISDNIFCAYIPFLEVDESYQHQGIGSTLVEKMLEQVSHLYMIDLVCDKEKASFYEKAGFKSWHAMIKRNYDRRSD